MSELVKQRLFSAVLVVMFVFGLAKQASAIEILDQFFLPPGSASFAVPVSNQFASFVDGAQTFTVGIAGILGHVELNLGFNSTQRGLILDIRPTTAGVPLENDASALASAFIPSASIPTGFPNFVSVDFAPFGVHVAVGQQLALVLRGAIRRVDDSALNWRGDKGDPYALGSAFVRTNVQPWTQLCGFGTCDIPGERVDLGFKTFVAPIPEPSTWLLLGSGLVGLILWRKANSLARRLSLLRILSS